jgi:hypothetical protein
MFRPPAPQYATLNAFLVPRRLDHPLHVDSRSVNLIAGKLAGLREMLDFRNGQAPGRGDHGIEIPR